MSVTNPTTVYVITSGEYSDYRVRTVFLEKGEAESFVEAHRARYEEMREENEYAYNDEYEIEEWEVGSVPQDRKVWRVEFLIGGDVDSVTLQDLDTEPGGPTAYKPLRPKPDYRNEMNVLVEAPDKETAIKIAAEKRAHFLASQAGMT